MKRTRLNAELYAADLYGDAAPASATGPLDYLPGLLLTGLATLAAAYLSNRYGAPVVLMSLLVGLALMRTKDLGREVSSEFFPSIVQLRPRKP